MSGKADIAGLAVDWGTTHLRVWSIATDGSAIERRTSSEGMRTLSSNDYSAVLTRHAAALGVDRRVPVIMCGMVGARDGWQQADYCALPVHLDTLADSVTSVDHPQFDVRILPGVSKMDAQAPDVMRSEETQLAGLSAFGATDGIVCMPGTHTKWATLADSRLVDFTTTMTGELFDMLVNHSTISNAIAENALETDKSVFREAVREAMARPTQLVTKLFGIRAGHNLNFSTHGRERLSGLLIGADIAAMRERNGAVSNVVLIGGNPMGDAYATALHEIGIQSTNYDGEEVALAGLVHAARQLWPDCFDQQKRQKVG